jgi:methionyl-tRNA formyltransferase|tara:strand:+ start:324 stop:1130 length:807 start_codon:yes stop_codon:yes gene_type:complete
MKSIIICRDEPRHIYFANYIENLTDVKALVIQRSKPFYKAIKGFFTVYRKSNKLIKFIKRKASCRVQLEKDYFFQESTPRFVHKICLLDVYNINDKKVVELIREKSPDLILTFGCGILKDELFFNTPSVGIVNLHSGIVPDYRGVDNVYWCLYNKDPSKIGATIHYVDRTIDTGDVLIRFYPEINPGDNEMTLFNKTIMGGINEFKTLLNDFNLAKTKIKGCAQTYRGHLYQEKDRNLLTDLKVSWFLRRGGLSFSQRKGYAECLYKI